MLLAGIGQDLKKIYSDETKIVENASLCSTAACPGFFESDVTKVNCVEN